jgi:hypothetical protein
MTDKGELHILRQSLMRLAQVANREGCNTLYIPNLGAERGWNRLCNDLIDWVEGERWRHPPEREEP